MRGAGSLLAPAIQTPNPELEPTEDKTERTAGPLAGFLAARTQRREALFVIWMAGTEPFFHPVTILPTVSGDQLLAQRLALTR